MIRSSLISSFLPVFIVAVLCGAAGAAGQLPVHHSMEAILKPADHAISVKDTITVPEGFPRKFTFMMHKGLRLKASGVFIRREPSAHPLAIKYRITLPPDTHTFVIQYRGVIDHPLEPVGKEQARGFSSAPGVISDQGVYLGGESYWYPAFSPLVTFSLAVQAPGGWDMVSQGERTSHDRLDNATSVKWESPEPQEEIYLVAGRFHEYAKAGPVRVMAFLRKPDRDLADRYLDAASRYIDMYGDLIGPYPYRKFALVENFWETGFGMPSFTLLGPTVIRLPFIINSSYPHEILHNWWGNGVYPDIDKGNWSEGLTAYLSDHLIREQQGAGAEYRQTTLQKYADYVSEGRDFPLTKFLSRHSTSSEAIGYGKALMLFHMLRLEMGDEEFIRALRAFYEKNRFRRASFEDLKTYLSAGQGKVRSEEFDQWVQRTGAPSLEVENVSAASDGAGYMLSLSVRQAQEGELYRLRVPVAVTMENRQKAEQFTITVSGKETKALLHVPAPPLRLDVDPEFDVFRRLHREEIPPAITEVLGSKRMLIILPASGRGPLLDAYKKLADSIEASGPESVEIRTDAEVRDLPGDKAVVVLGWENNYSHGIWPLFTGYDVIFHDPNLMIGSGRYARPGHTVVMTARHPGEMKSPMMFIASDNAADVPGLARKLPHYHKYSYLVFEGDEPENVAKGRWPVLHSPLTVFLPKDDGSIAPVEMGRLSPRKPLIAPQREFSSDSLMGTVRFLSSESLEGRGLGTKALDKAADYMAEAFRKAGLSPAEDHDGFFQKWEETVRIDDRRGARPVVLKNVVGMIRGKDAALSSGCVVVGAHYDGLGMGWPDGLKEDRGKIHPGADDNASGVAVLLELARHFASSPPPDRSIIFAAFTGEEAGRLGSRHFAAGDVPFRIRDCIGMINLDTVGRLGNRKLLAIGAESAKEWVHILRGAGYVAGVETEAVSQQLDSSDQVSFSEAGVPAIQLFTGPHADYHRPSDTPDKVDPDGMVKVAAVAKEAIEYLASRKGPLTASPAAPVASSQGEGRKVSIGTVPDFAYHGKGFRLSGTVPGSPAEAAGMREGDVIIRLDGKTVDSIKDFSAILKTLQPGSRAAVVFLREGIEATLEVEVKAR